MSKYIEFKVRAYYDNETGGVKLISKDKVMKNKPFQISLSRNSESFQSIIDVMEDKKVISDKSLLKTIPEYVALPHDIVENQNNQYEDKYFHRETGYPMYKNDYPVHIGKTAEDKSIAISLNMSPHTFICGKSGTGKTELLKTIAKQFSDNLNYDIMYVSQKEDATSIQEFTKGFTNINNISLNYGVDGMFETLLNLLDTIEKRYEKIMAEEVSHILYTTEKVNSVVLLIDDLDSHNNIKDESMTGIQKLKKNAIHEIISKIARLGRVAGIFIFIASVHEQAVYGETKANLGRRILLGTNDARNGQMVLGIEPPFSGSLMENPGRGIIRTYAGEPRIFQTYIVE